MIYEELTSERTGYELDSSNLEFTPSYNYRSSQKIVDLANAVQFYRKKNLKVDIKKAQESKRPTYKQFENINVFVDLEFFKNKRFVL